MAMRVARLLSISLSFYSRSVSSRANRFPSGATRTKGQKVYEGDAGEKSRADEAGIDLGFRGLATRSPLKDKAIRRPNRGSCLLAISIWNLSDDVDFISASSVRPPAGFAAGREPTHQRPVQVRGERGSAELQFGQCRSRHGSRR